MYSGIKLPTNKGTNKELDNEKKNIIEERSEEIGKDVFREAIFYSQNRQLYKKSRHYSAWR
jgi:hypothetical protein